MRRYLFALLTPLALAFGAGAGLAQDPAPQELAEISRGTWTLVSLDGAPVDYAASFVIDAEGKVSGHAPCNRYFGQNQKRLPELGLDALAVTRMACPLSAEEDLFLSALSEIRHAQISDGRLQLKDAVAVRLEFIRAEIDQAL